MRRVVGALAALTFVTGCKPSAPDSATAVEQRTSVDRYDPARDLGPLFQDVQLAGVFPDSKTFVDARPRSAPAAISTLFARRTRGSRFRSPGVRRPELRDPAGRREVSRRTPFRRWKSTFGPCGRCSRAPADSADARSSLIPLPHPYVVPGGRFREVYYWDSYFTMLGLVESGRVDLVKRHARQFRAPRHAPSDTSRTATAPTTSAAASRRSSRRWWGCTRKPPTRRTRCAISTRSRREHAFWMDGADRVKPGHSVSPRRDACRTASR